MTARGAVLAILALGMAAVARPTAARLPKLRPPASATLRWADVTIETSSPPLTEKLLTLGERLYGWNCMPCHGAEGKGDGPVGERQGLQPRDYTRGYFKLKSSGEGELPFDEDLYRTITAGIPASRMPSFAQFDPIDRWAVVAYLKSLTFSTLDDGTVVRHFERRPARTRVELPPRPARADPARGAWLFRTGARCVVCHGERGRGDGPASAGLKDALERPISVPDWAAGESSFKAGARPEDVFRILTTGMAGSPMPSFAALPAEDRWELAFFVASLVEPADEPAAPSGWRP